MVLTSGLEGEVIQVHLCSTKKTNRQSYLCEFMKLNFSNLSSLKYKISLEFQVITQFNFV